MNNILHFVPFKVQNKTIYLYFHIWTLLDYFAWFTCMKPSLGAAPCSSSVWNKLFQIPLSQLFFSWLKRAFIVFNYSYKKSQTQRALDLSILFIAGQSQQFDWQVQKVKNCQTWAPTQDQLWCCIDVPEWVYVAARLSEMQNLNCQLILLNKVCEITLWAGWENKLWSISLNPFKFTNKVSKSLLV